MNEWLMNMHSRDDNVSIVENNVMADLQTAHGAANIMVNVGAHRGGHLPAFTEKKWTIYTFEPDRNNRAVLEKYFADKVIVDSRAVAEQARNNVQFFTSEQSTGISGLLNFHSTHQATYSVDVTTLADVCRESGLDHIDYLLIDTEGFDLPVLRGLDWEAIRPETILCEFDDSKSRMLDYDFHDLARYLNDKSYCVYVSEWYPVSEYGATHQWRGLKQYPCELSDQAAWGNLLAFSSDVTEDTLVAVFEKEINRKPNVIKEFIRNLIYKHDR